MQQSIGAKRMSSEISEADVVCIMERHPTLSAFGFGCFGQYHREFRNDISEELKGDRQELRESVDQCQRACDWLSRVEISKSIHRCHSSYGLKHQVERYYDMIPCSNGAFIAAAIHMGFKWKQVGPNAYFNFHQRSIDELFITN
jgi:hypothetical protein